MIAIVDYGINNLASVRNAFCKVGAEVEVTADRTVIGRADGVVLPGIGSAAAGMRQILDRGLAEPLRQAAESGRPFLAICLGMQLLFESSQEQNARCLGILPGTVALLDVTLKVPQIGWNRVQTASDRPMWAGLAEDPYFYFVHSYVCEPSDSALIAGRTTYGTAFCSAVERDHIWGTQFHPERSAAAGLSLIANFASRCGSLQPS
ncbi:MAG: imidazole glycerol phosphate synthase subunit HisH [Chloroflexota bacterium]